MTNWQKPVGQILIDACLSLPYLFILFFIVTTKTISNHYLSTITTHATHPLNALSSFFSQ